MTDAPAPSTTRERDRVLLGAWSLAPAQLSALAEVLRATALGDRDARQGVLDRLGASFDPPRSARDREDILNVVTEALAQDAVFDRLLDEVEALGPDDPAYLRLTELVATMLPRSPLRRRELAGLLAIDLQPPPSPSQLAVGVRTAWPELAAPAPPVPDIRMAALVLLNVMDLDAGLRRLVRFVQWLARYAESMGQRDKAALLHFWWEHISVAHGLPVRAERPAEAARHPADGPFLLVELDPETPSRGRYAVHLWLWRPGSGFEPVEGWARQDNWYLPDELEPELDELIDLALRQLGDFEGEMQIQFWLDYDLLHHAVDGWTLGTDGATVPHPLGADYPVVVRPRRRRPLRAAEKREWARRWRALRAADQAMDELCLWVGAGGAVSGERLWTMLRENEAQVLVVPVEPPGNGDRPLHRLLHQLVNGGLPIALCVRRAPEEAAPGLEAMKEALMNTSLADLPGKVRSWRAAAFGTDKDHFGRDLTLLWDDYDHLPGVRFGATRGGDRG